MAFSVWWRITTSSRFGRCRSVGEVAVTGDCSQRILGNGFAQVWRVPGSPCRAGGFQLAACLNGARSGSFLPLLGEETCALWREVGSRGLGGGLAFGDVRSGFGCQRGGFGLVGTCVACVSGLG